MPDQTPTLTKTLTTQKYNWRDDSLCDGYDTAMFFPDARGINMEKYVSENLPCDLCWVKKQCIDYADDNEIEYGIWGGKYRSPDLVSIRNK